MPILVTARYEILALGPFRIQDVHLQFDSSAQVPISSEQRVAIQARCDGWRAEGRKVVNGPLYRVLSWTATSHRLDIAVGPTFYEEYVGLNSRAIEALTVSSATAAGDQLVLERRSQKVAEGRGMLHVKPSGHVHPPQEPWQAMLAEYEEELAILPAEVEEPVCLGLVRSLSANCYSLIYALRVRAPLEELKQRSAVDAWEHEELQGLECRPETLRQWPVDVYPHRVTGPGHATVLLYGRHCYGQDWYDDACRAFLAAPAGTIRSETE